jgi:hypothetical protein
VRASAVVDSAALGVVAPLPVAVGDAPIKS